ncbi:MAG: outer membrane beta-barrel protein [Cytophagales bacterium]|nr:outer membrane beta-barrel protein [Cytophagales bacterium]
MRHIIISLFLGLLLLTSGFTSLYAQEETDIYTASSQSMHSIWSAEYQSGLSIGDAKDFINNYSWRGFSFSGEAFLGRNFTIGGTADWSGFYKKRPRKTYEISPGTTITADVSNYLYLYPLLVTGGYYFMPEAPVRPFVKLGAGAYYIEKESDFGYVYTSTNDWRFGFQPQAGVFIPVASHFAGIILKAKYNIVFYNKENINNISHFSFNFGFAFSY